jgi:hypothetical protein
MLTQVLKRERKEKGKMKKIKIILPLMLVATLLLGLRMPTGNAASQLDINIAIEKGLAWFASVQASDGSWGGYTGASTAMAVLSFENAPNNHFGWNLTDPYHTTVQKGLDWLFAHAVVQAIGVQAAGDPDSNGNTIGIYLYDGSGQVIYETPMMLMAIIASQAPTNVTTTGPANVIGRSYHDIAVDIVDYLAWGQNEYVNGRGGWRYGPNYAGSDNSVSQWPVLGLMAAELWGITAPAFVKSELLNYWIPYADDLDGDYNTNYYYGAFGYAAPEWGARGLQTIAETCAGIMELTYCGVPKTDPRIIAAQGFIVRDWSTTYGGPSGWQVNLGNFYAMYAVMKACRLATPTPIAFIVNYTNYPTMEWYNGTGEYADILVANQASGGYWNQWVSPEGINTELSTAFAELILEFVPVKVTYKLTVTVQDSASNLISGAQVIIDGPETHTGSTGGDGKIVFDKIQAGSYQVNATAAGHLPSATTTVSVTSDTEYTITLELIPTSVVPEVPIGTILASAAMLFALMGYLFLPKWKKKLQIG